MIRESLPKTNCTQKMALMEEMRDKTVVRYTKVAGHWGLTPVILA
jgi:hypothetical protein